FESLASSIRVSAANWRERNRQLALIGLARERRNKDAAHNLFVGNRRIGEPSIKQAALDRGFLPQRVSTDQMHRLGHVRLVLALADHLARLDASKGLQEIGRRALWDAHGPCAEHVAAILLRNAGNLRERVG